MTLKEKSIRHGPRCQQSPLNVDLDDLARLLLFVQFRKYFTAAGRSEAKGGSSVDFDQLNSEG